MNKIQVSVKNWHKYKGRTDVKVHSWFRLSNRLLEDPDFFDFTHSELLVWIQILSLCSQKNSRTFCLDIRHTNLVCRIAEKDIFSSLKKLSDLGIIQADVTDAVRARYADVTDTCATEQNRTVQYSTEQDTTEQYSTEQGAKKNKIMRPKSVAPDVKPAIALYCKLWAERYSLSPPISGKVAGLIKVLVKDHGLQKACDFIQAYLEMPDAWFVTKRHDIPTLISNLNSITHYMATGRIISRTEINQLDQRVNSERLIDMIDSGEI